MSSKQKYLFFFFLTCLPWTINSQIGGLYTFDFLDLAGSSRATALAGYPIALSDDDIAQAFHNPALLQPGMSHQLSINHNFHLADIGFGSIAYGIPLRDSTLMMMVSGGFVDYGDFTRADDFGNRQGSFSGQESSIHLGVSKKLDERLRVGVQLKYAFSSLDNFSSSGIGGDIGVHYTNPEKRSNWAIVFRNFGGQLSGFDFEKEPWPFNLQIGYAKRLEHLPLTWMITAHHLQRWDLRSPLDDQGTITIIGEVPTPPSSLNRSLDNLFRHLSFGAELGLGQNEVVRIRLGYNHLRAKELAVTGFRSLSGLSFGFGVKIKKIRLDYGVGRYHLAGGANHLSLTVDLHELVSRL